jgi:hypothetical protein
MIVALIDKLADRIIDLLKHHQESKRKFFENYISPVYSLFEEVHAEYLKSFQKYRNMLKENRNYDKVVDELCDLIKEEHLFTTHQREKLVGLLSTPKESDLENFTFWISYYLFDSWEAFHGSYDLDHSDKGFGPQRWRKSLFDYLKGIQEGHHIGTLEKISKRHRVKAAIDVLDGLVDKMQTVYSKITKDYFELKKKYLK